MHRLRGLFQPRPIVDGAANPAPLHQSQNAADSGAGVGNRQAGGEADAGTDEAVNAIAPKEPDGTEPVLRQECADDEQLRDESSQDNLDDAHRADESMV